MSKSSQRPNIANYISALLVIDVQRALFSRSSPIHNAVQLISNINSLVEAWEHAGSLVVYIQHSNEKSLIQGTPDWEIHPEIHIVKASEYIHKLHGNAFEKTDLDDLLSTKGLKDIVVTGLVTQGCVRATCIGALDLGYRVILVENGHSNYSKGAEKIIKDWNQKLAQQGVQLTATDEIIGKINRAAQ